MIVEIPDDIKITTIRIADLDEGWRDFKVYLKCQLLGNRWFDEGKRLY